MAAGEVGGVRWLLDTGVSAQLGSCLCWAGRRGAWGSGCFQGERLAWAGVWRKMKEVLDQTVGQGPCPAGRIPRPPPRGGRCSLRLPGGTGRGQASGLFWLEWWAELPSLF